MSFFLSSSFPPLLSSPFPCRYCLPSLSDRRYALLRVISFSTSHLAFTISPSLDSIPINEQSDPMEIDRLFHRRHRGKPRGGDAVLPRDSSSYYSRRDASRGSDRRCEGICLQRTRDGSAIKTTHSKVHTEENRQTSSLKANGVPMKTLLKEEMSKEGRPRQNSPGLIARLMGLDTLPASGSVCKSGAYSQKLIEDHSCDFNAMEPEYKDVFEVGERSQTKHKTEPSNRISRRPRNSDSKEVLRQNFVSARCQEHVKGFRNTCDVSESLDSNEDSFGRFLQKPHSLIAKYFFDLDSVPSSPEPTHITILKSSKPTKLKSSEFSLESIKKCEKFTGKEWKSAIDDAAPKLGKKARHKSDCSGVPTRIVVLKPSLGKIPSGNVSFPFQCSMTSSVTGHRRHNSSESCAFLSENREHQHFSSKIEAPRSQIQNSYETTIEIAKTRKKCRSKESFGGVTKFDHRMQNKNTFADKAVACAHSGHLGESENRYLEFSSHPAESFVSREARRHLSKQFSMSNGCEDVGYRDQGPSTLAEMLALSDGETSASNQLDSGLVEDYPFVLNSRDGWKDIWPRQLSRSRSLPSLSNFCSDINSSWQEESYENSIPKCVIDIPVSNSAEQPESRQKLEGSSPRNGNVRPSKILLDECKEGQTQLPHDIATTYVDDNSKNDASLSEIAVSFYDAVASAEDILYDGDKSRKSTTEFPNGELLQDAISSGDDNDDILISKMKVSESMDADPSNEPAILKAELPQVSKGAHQSVPVSLLDPLDEEVLDQGDETSSGCFQRVNSELQSLRLQLQLLRSESASTSTEGSAVPSDEETNGTCGDFEGRPRIPQFSSAYEEDRDFSYVLGILEDSGLQLDSTDEIPDTCHLPETPIDPVFFAKRERFYEGTAWQREERKLLFDLLNCILSERIAPKKMPFRSVLNAKLNAEDIWTSLVRRRLESTCESLLDIGWLDVANDIETIGWDVERMVADVLLDEIVTEFIRGEKSLEKAVRL